jgi:hypothetical protein
MSEYYNQLKAITKSKLHKGLLGFGLFADKIPPFLSSESFYEFIIDKKPGLEKKEHDYIRYENMRNINVPRHLAIPHPLAHVLLCKTLTDNWTKIKKHFRTHTTNQSHKISKIHIRKIKHEDKLFEMNYKGYFDQAFTDIDLLIGARYLVNADISNCFPSIYSHSIPWALVSKPVAKTKTGNRHSSEWFNQIDFYLRNTKNAETNGILIGPHTSNLISEIVLTVVDYNLKDKGYRYIRHIDDYTCYCANREEAEQFLIDLSIELKEFELNLNHKKSKISSLPLASLERWVRKLNYYKFSYYRKKKKRYLSINEIEAFLDLCIELMSLSNDNTSILNYGLKILSGKKLEKKAKQYLLKRVHHLVLIYPYLVQVLDKSIFEAFNIKNKDIVQIAIDLFSIGIKTKMYEACSYAIFFSLKYNFELKKIEVAKEALKSKDCIFLLLVYLYEKKHKNSLREFVEKAKELNQDDFDRFWLYIYEVLPANQLDKTFVQMKRNKVTFIKDGFV